MRPEARPTARNVRRGAVPPMKTRAVLQSRHRQHLAILRQSLYICMDTNLDLALHPGT